MSLKLSVVIPVYNAEQTIERTLASLHLIEETHRSEVEIILVNDGSTDDSELVARQYFQRNEGWNWTLRTQANRGAAAARNTALEIAHGEWILFLDADDELAFEPLAQIATLDGSSCGSFSLEYRRGARQMKIRPTRVDSANFLSVMTAANPFQPSSVLFRRDCIDAPFVEGIACVEDWLFWLSNPRIFAKQSVRAEITSAIIHVHGGNISSQYARAGANRQRVAQLALERRSGDLTTGQANNLRLQAAIGKIQQGHWPAWQDFLRIPSSPLLYMKFIVYTAARLLGVKATPY